MDFTFGRVPPNETREQTAARILDWRSCVPLFLLRIISVFSIGEEIFNQYHSPEAAAIPNVSDAEPREPPPRRTFRLPRGDPSQQSYRLKCIGRNAAHRIDLVYSHQFPMIHLNVSDVLISEFCCICPFENDQYNPQDSLILQHIIFGMMEHWHLIGCIPVEVTRNDYRATVFFHRWISKLYRYEDEIHHPMDWWLAILEERMNRHPLWECIKEGVLSGYLH